MKKLCFIIINCFVIFYVIYFLISKNFNLHNLYTINSEPSQKLSSKVLLHTKVVKKYMQTNDEDAFVLPKYYYQFDMDQYITKERFCNSCSMLAGLPLLNISYKAKSHQLNPLVLANLNTTYTPKYVIGIPSAQRSETCYLIDTLRSIFVALDDTQLNLVLIVVQLSGDGTYVKNQRSKIYSLFTKYVKSGNLRLITPPDEFYPDWNAIKPTLNDPPERMKWRTKQTLDYIYLFSYCYGKAKYYLQLEDDIVTKYNFLYIIDRVVSQMEQAPSSWIMLDFCYLGFIGKLFRDSELPKLISYFSIFYLDKPVDWLLQNYFYTKYCIPENTKDECDKNIKSRVLHFTSLFQHIGVKSSLIGKEQKLKVHNFENTQFLVQHDNPPAQVSTTLKTYESHSLGKAYDRLTYFWATTPQPGDTIIVQFKKPSPLNRILIKTGHETHYQDLLYNATLEIKLVMKLQSLFKLLSTPLPQQPYIIRQTKNYKDRQTKVEAFNKSEIDISIDDNPPPKWTLSLLRERVASYLVALDSRFPTPMPSIFTSTLTSNLVNSSLGEAFIPISSFNSLGTVDLEPTKVLTDILTGSNVELNDNVTKPTFKIEATGFYAHVRKRLKNMAIQEIRIKIHTTSPFWITISEILIAS